MIFIADYKHRAEKHICNKVYFYFHAIPCQKHTVKPICCISLLRLDKKRRLYTALSHCKQYWLKQSLEMESKVLTQSRHSASLMHTDKNAYKIWHNWRNNDQGNTALESEIRTEVEAESSENCFCTFAHMYLQTCNFFVPLVFFICANLINFSIWKTEECLGALFLCLFELW